MTALLIDTSFNNRNSLNNSLFLNSWHVYDPHTAPRKYTHVMLEGVSILTYPSCRELQPAKTFFCPPKRFDAFECCCTAGCEISCQLCRDKSQAKRGREEETEETTRPMTYKGNESDRIPLPDEGENEEHKDAPLCERQRTH